MELQSPDGATIAIDKDSVVELGRRALGLGLEVSRHHLSLRLDPDAAGDGIRVSFEVIGKNPIWVSRKSGGEERAYRRSEKGELGADDRFSLSLENPTFLIVRRPEGGVLDAVKRREKRTLERRMGKEKREEVESLEGGDEEAVVGSLDVSQIDPAKEFGFLVMGHEFDRYPRGKIRALKNWDWFLEEPREDSDNDELVDEAEIVKGKKGRGRRKKKGGDNEDEEWTGESEGEKEVLVKGGGSKRPKYSTRSKDPKKPRNGARDDRKALKNSVDEEDEEDETLGGFIVNGDEEEEEEEAEEEESEEEELGEEDDEE